jgi:hypothetical protein
MNRSWAAIATPDAALAVAGPTVSATAAGAANVVRPW